MIERIEIFCKYQRDFFPRENVGKETKEFMNGIADMSMAELNDELVAAKKELFNLRFQNATNQLDNTSRIKEVRRNIARIQTAMSKERKAN